MNRLAHDGFGIRLGNFFDIHASGSTGHENYFAHAAIDKNAEIKFALDVQTLFDKNALDGAAAWAGLRRDEIHAQHVRSDVCGFVGRVRKLDAPRFAATASMNLRFYN